MRVALLDRSNQIRGTVTSTANLPAPMGGWNTRDALAEMPTLNATLLDNWFPRAGQCVLRGGSVASSTGMAGTVKTLAQYQPAGGTSKFYGVTDAGIYDITAGGAVGAVAQALTNGYWNSVNFTNSAGDHFLWGVNGTDTAKHWSGTAWATPAITVVASETLILPTVHKHRIFAAQKDSMDVWYLPLDAIAGAAAKLPYGSFFRKGGYVMSICTWTLDSGFGPDDLFVAISSEGEVAVFSGTDPSSATTWALVGVWQVNKPVGRRCFKALGADVLLISEDGAFPLSKLLKGGNINFASALSNIIQPSFTNAVSNVGITTAGWEACIYPRYDALIINIPAGASSAAAQVVMNTTTGAWCSFSGWGAYAFEVYQGYLYFAGASGKVYRAWDGVLTSDSGADIVAKSRQAYNYFGNRTRLKLVNLFRLLLQYDGALELRWGVSPDYTDVMLSSLSLRGNSLTGALWDTALWDTFYWAGTTASFKNWRSASHSPGYALALWLQIATKDANVAWSGTDFMLADGGPM